MKKKALSHVLAVVLIILIAILAAILIWVYMRSTVTESSERVYMQEQCLTTTTEILNCEYGGPLNNIYFVTGLVRHEKGDSTNVKVVFLTEDGNSTATEMEPIGILETKKILPPMQLYSKPEYAVASPVVYNQDKTKSLVCPLEKRVVCEDVRIAGDLCEIPTSVEDVDPFVEALNYWVAGREQEYNNLHPDCHIINADFDCTGSYTALEAVYFADVLIDRGWLLCNRSMICYDRGSGNCWDDPTWCDDNCKVN